MRSVECAAPQLGAPLRKKVDLPMAWPRLVVETSQTTSRLGHSRGHQSGRNLLRSKPVHHIN